MKKVPRWVKISHAINEYYTNKDAQTYVHHAFGVDKRVKPYEKKGLSVPNETTVQPVWSGEEAFEKEMFEFVAQTYTKYSYQGHSTGENAVQTYIYIVDGELCLKISNAPDSDKQMALKLLHYLTNGAPWIDGIRSTLKNPVLAEMDIHYGCTGSEGPIHVDSKERYKQVNVVVPLNNLYGDSRMGGTQVCIDDTTDKPSRIGKMKKGSESNLWCSTGDVDANDWVAFRGDAWHHRGAKNPDFTCPSGAKRTTMFLVYMDKDGNPPYKPFSSPFGALSNARAQHTKLKKRD